MSGSARNSPSQAQLKLAASIEEKAGVPLDESTRHDRAQLSAWIDQHIGKLPRIADPQPTSKQVHLAEKIASAKGVEIPREALQSGASLSNWIDSYAPKTGGSKLRRTGGLKRSKGLKKGSGFKRGPNSARRGDRDE